MQTAEGTYLGPPTKAFVNPLLVKFRPLSTGFTLYLRIVLNLPLLRKTKSNKSFITEIPNATGLLIMQLFCPVLLGLVLMET